MNAPRFTLFAPSPPKRITWISYGVISILAITAIGHARFRVQPSLETSENTPATRFQNLSPTDDIVSDRTTLSLPPMSLDQIEQARTTLISEGLSPIHAETILPSEPQP